MPRAKNPIADLKALSSKADEIAARQLVLAEAAKSFVGNLAFEAGLDDWDLKDLKAGFSHLAKLGPAGVH